MSWAEVKKINSNMSVPLDKKVAYVGGVIQRGAAVKSIADDSMSLDVDSVILSVEGKGALLEYGCEVHATTAAASNTNVDLRIYLDGVWKGSAQAYINYPTVCDMSSQLKTDLNALYSYDPKKVVNSTVVINYPLYFNESAKIVKRISKSINGVTTKATAKVILFN